MKRMICFLLMPALLLALAGCGREEVIPQPPEPSMELHTPTPPPTTAPTPLPPESPEPTTAEFPEADEIFPRSFCFNSGAGGWATEVTIAEDGSFSGYYQDMDMGTPATYFCKFSGQFSAPEQLNDYTYSMHLEKLEKEDVEEWIAEDGMSWIPSIPYGMESGEEYLLYLPSSPLEDLPEFFAMWAAHGYGSWNGETLPGYGLYNSEMEYGFYETHIEE